MYNKKAKTSAILLIITAIIFVGLIIMLPFLSIDAEEGEELSAGLTAIVVILFGYPLIYASAIPFVVVALIFGLKMLKQQLRQKLISLNVRQLVASCILLPVLAVGLLIGGNVIFKSTLGLFPTIYSIVALAAYAVSLIAQIVTIVALKKLPDENVSTVIE